MKYLIPLAIVVYLFFPRQQTLADPRILMDDINRTAQSIRLSQEEQIAVLWHSLLIDFAERHGVVNPHRFAYSLMHVTEDLRPVLAAQCVTESHGQPDALGDADEEGAFQVIEYWWGPVPDTMPDQALQAQEIMLTLIDRHGSIPDALVAYNGSRRYAKKVLRLAEELNIG